MRAILTSMRIAPEKQGLTMRWWTSSGDYAVSVDALLKQIRTVLERHDRRELGPGFCFGRGFGGVMDGVNSTLDERIREGALVRVLGLLAFARAARLSELLC